MRTPIKAGSLGALLALASLGIGQAQTITIPSTYVQPSASADASKPGFLWRVSQVASTGAYPQDSTARTEAQLAGLLGDNIADPNAVGSAAGPGTPPNPSSAPIEFIIPTVISLDVASGHGDFANDDNSMPGFPGTTGVNDNAAAEGLTWLDLPAGDLTMGVNSDDGFRVTIGGGNPRDKVSSVAVGEYSGGRGAADTIFTFHISQAGLYAARLIWENGGGDSNVEWFTEKADGTKVLINDSANGGIKAYRALTGAGPAYVSSVSPDVNSTTAQPNTAITAQIQDGATAVTASSVKLSLDGVLTPALATKSGSVTTITYSPTNIFTSASVHTASLAYTDDSAKTVQWSFTITTYVSLPASSKVTPDTTKPGFVLRVSRISDLSTWRNPVTGYIGDGNSNERSELQLAGLIKDASGTPLPNLADPNAKGAASAAGTAPNPAWAPIAFEVPTTVNLNIAASTGDLGDFKTDGQMPGAPGTDGSSDNFAAEIVTYLDLPAGLVTMGVNSDDGFRIKVGNDATDFAQLGEYEGSRTSADTLFSFFVPEAGVYPFRATYENGGSPGGVEWFTVQNGKNVLINDTANGGIKAYRALSTPTAPRVASVTPIPGMRWLNQDSSSLNILLADGANPVDQASVTLSVDGQSVTPTMTRQGSYLWVTWTPTTLEVPTAVHTASLGYKDSTGANATTKQWQFRSLKNLVLPTTAAAGENFDSTAEGSIPAGWTGVNFTDCSGTFCDTPGLDLDDLNSDTYKAWVVVSKDRLSGLKSRIFANVAPNQILNGQPVTDLGSGNVLYAESDVRGGNQVQFITSKPFDLSKVTHVTMSFESLYEQNQDSIGAVEYSVDGGTNWLPVLYYLDGTPTSDIKLNADGSVNATHTMEDANNDTAAWTDPVTKQALGHKYGDFIKAPITEALAPYIVSRVNDDPVEGKRIEVFRLWQADGKSDVRLRLAQGGTGSWYFGIDNIQFFDVDAPGTQPGGGTAATPTVGIARTGTGLTITFTGTLQSADKVNGPYTDMAGPSPLSVTPSGTAKFYQAKQ